ncbi:MULTISPECIES: hypothetical protein [unclassified Campylobacter]|uniref:hypothetical protein n=1 Tax=unclassified Campylobacter TaxID=2593542 RepID=UPI001237C6EA|nr:MULTISPECIES: hypothetical protein [unclassified Campylobacter]KAA6220593.1 hypothetical protein FMM54_08470 [Campylobacter sp. LR185c]KAA6226279.1 hypothetical protein FMM57_05725 [Campylobacter sp. LR286c]KAA6226771.1 hypothetical protein FMM55_04295 [Campylobacter sp. LR196d]KAA6230208.1 hypothetical protein FMM58_05925 [Campylobacter sp. LR291e]KAA6233729.1 hypothetical protein FMM56_02140 [Campylobacter sp. LR264d]
MSENLKEIIDNLQYELSITLEALLLVFGVKRDKLEDAIEIYIENIDEVLKDSKNEGVDEILEMLEYLKKEHKELFK